MRELFIYYRVAAAQGAGAAAEVSRFQSSLVERHPGLCARLLRRCDEAHDMQTWLEIYAWPERQGGVSEPVQAEIERDAAPLARWIEGPRHCEAFHPL